MEMPAKLTEEQFDIAIGFDGTWMHQGAPMTRLPLVRLFATVLSRDEQGDYWLKTPVEQGRIAVADAPFIATGYRLEAGALYLTDNIGRETPVDDAHPLSLRVPHEGGGPMIPYHQLGGGIEARLSTSVYYALVDKALAEGPPRNGRLFIGSFGGQHPLGMESA